MKHPRVAALSLLSLLASCSWLLAACSGGGDPAPSTTPAAAPAPQAAISPGQLFDWAQRLFPSLFPPGPANQSFRDGATAYTYRFYPGTGNYLGVGDNDGVVYGLGPFTSNLLLPFGALSDFGCEVTGGCTRVTPDADGNLAAGGLRAADFAVRSGDVVSFEALGPLDSVIEVGSPALTSEQLCTAPTLPAGGAKAVPAQTPMPAGLYAANSFSGPYRTYPAGLYAMSVSSDECGFVERSSACVAPNESTVARQLRADGGSDHLCAVTPKLMSPLDPTRVASIPAQGNPACVPGRVLDATWADPAVQGVFIRLSWNDLQPTGWGSYDWTALDRAIAQAVRHSKTFTLGIRVGGNSIPDWVFASGHPTLGPARPVKLKDWGTGPDSMPDGDCGFDYTLASPSDAAFKALFKQALTDLAAHIRADQRRFSLMAGVKVTGMGLQTLENRMPKRCAIAVRNPALGDTGTQGHLIDTESRSLAAPVFDPKFNLASSPATARIRNVASCVCNPQVLAFAGYRPSTLVAFYDEVEATLRAGFGHKQMIFMNITEGFPLVGESGRFEGDHLVPAIVSSSVNGAGEVTYTYGALQAAPAQAPTDIPDGNDTTRALIEAGRRGSFAGGDLVAARAFGVENAALDVVGFSLRPNSGLKCSQQVAVATGGSFAGSPVFPIGAAAAVDSGGVNCPNWLATKEGVSYDKVTGFQVTNDMQGARDIDAALWNMTLNTNGLFFEFYERDAWLARKQSAANARSVLDPAPPVQAESATPNHASATAKSGVDWNALLLARAAAFSADPRHANPYQAHPFASSYSVNVASAPGATRYVFNSRACAAWAERGVPVRINRITILD